MSPSASPVDTEERSSGPSISAWDEAKASRVVSCMVEPPDKNQVANIHIERESYVRHPSFHWQIFCAVMDSTACLVVEYGHQLHMEGFPIISLSLCLPPRQRHFPLKDPTFGTQNYDCTNKQSWICSGICSMNHNSATILPQQWNGEKKKKKKRSNSRTVEYQLQWEPLGWSWKNIENLLFSKVLTGNNYMILLYQMPKDTQYPYLGWMILWLEPAIAVDPPRSLPVGVLTSGGGTTINQD